MQPPRPRPAGSGSPGSRQSCSSWWAGAPRSPAGSSSATASPWRLFPSPGRPCAHRDDSPSCSSSPCSQRRPDGRCPSPLTRTSPSSPPISAHSCSWPRACPPPSPPSCGAASGSGWKAPSSPSAPAPSWATSTSCRPRTTRGNSTWAPPSASWFWPCRNGSAAADSLSPHWRWAASTWFTTPAAQPGCSFSSSRCWSGRSSRAASARRYCRPDACASATFCCCRDWREWPFSVSWPRP